MLVFYSTYMHFVYINYDKTKDNLYIGLQTLLYIYTFTLDFI